MNWLVPPHKRPLPGKRWLSIILRSLHLVGIAGLAGAYLYSLPEAVWGPYLLLGVGSGFLLLARELYVDGIWLLQLRGQLVQPDAVYRFTLDPGCNTVPGYAPSRVTAGKYCNALKRVKAVDDSLFYTGMYLSCKRMDAQEQGFNLF